MSRRLVVTGTRYGRDDVAETLDAWVAAFGEPWMVLGGDCNNGVRSQRGVDKQAGDWSRARGHHGVTVYAHWDDGAAAGPNRNGRMVGRARPGHHLLAFPGARSIGTWNCHDQGKAAGLLCVVVEPGWLDRLCAMDAAFRARGGVRRCD